MNRRNFIKSASSASALASLGLLSGCGGSSTNTTTDVEPEVEIETPTETETIVSTLLIPPIITDTGAGILLTAQSGTTEFFDGASSNTLGFNGSYLGPTIRVRKGDSVNINVQNNLDEDISSHWHGLHIPGNVDGGPHQLITPGTTWEPTLNIVQEASFNWYHSHVHGQTSEHVYKGLAGLFIIDDDNSDALALPNEYGVDDIPLIIQDKQFTNNVINDNENLNGRFTGNTIVVNSVVDPLLVVEAKRIRFRLLNASNARFYKFSLSDGRAFDKIATEGGLLNAPVSITSLSMAPGERNEIIIDLTGMAAGSELVLESSNEENDNGDLPDTFTVLTLSVSALTGENPELPTVMNTIDDVETVLAAETIAATRSFNLAGGTINNESFDMADINHDSGQGNYERWTITGGDHPFHVHGCSFLIIDDNGNTPDPENRGWKDTVVTLPQTAGVEVLVQFNYLADTNAPYMYHCHILGHEDAGMMGQFTVS